MGNFKFCGLDEAKLKHIKNNGSSAIVVGEGHFPVEDFSHRSIQKKELIEDRGQMGNRKVRNHSH